MDKKNVLITGSSRGIGRACALAFAGAGWHVFINCRESLDQLREVNEEILASGGSCTMLPGDVSDPDSVRAMFRQIASVCDGPDVLVNNAGIMYCQQICDTSRRALSLMMMLHNYTPLMLCREFVPGMIARGKGYVLNVSSLAAWMDWPAIGMYGNTKRFVKGFSRSLRVECMGTGVSVTNAYFGAVDTPLIPLKPSLRRLARHLGVMISADKATDRALSALFHRRKGTIPGLLNWIFLPVVVCLPDRVLSWALRKPGRHLLMDV